MKKDLIVNFALKAVGFVFSSLLIFGLVQHSEDLISLNLIISFFFLLRSLDFSLSYLRRLINSDKLDTRFIDNFFIYVVQSTVIFGFCHFFDVQTPSTVLLIICCATYSELSVLGNRNQATYIYNGVHPFCGIFAYTIHFIGFEIPIENCYLLLTTLVQLSLIIWLRNKEAQNYKITTIRNTYHRRHSFQFLAILLFMCHSELSQILIYKIGSLGDYTFLSIVKRGEMILFGLMAIVVNVIWNKYGSKISWLDTKTISVEIYIICFAMIILLYVLANFFYKLEFIYLIIILTIVLNIWYYFYSQIFLRIGNSLFTLKVGIFETTVTLAALMLASDLEIYFYACFLVSVLKIFFSKGINIENIIK